ncbi:MAG: VanZ family protein [bacterium]
MRCKPVQFFKYWFPPIIYAALIFFLSSRSSIDIGPDIPNIDKLYHALIYFGFAVLLWRAFYYASPAPFKKRAILFALILTVLFGISDEWHQLHVAFRHADFFDLLFDSIGASLALLSVSWWNNGQREEEKYTGQ